MLHADLDAFYASVEQRDEPRLQGRPVIVGAGVVLTASYEARAFGVRTAMGQAQARRLCPWAAIVEPRFAAYAAASRAVFEIFEDTTPLVEGLSIDEAFLEVGGLRRLSGTPGEIAVHLRRRVRDQVDLPITVGVARTKFLAKVASRVGKPDGLLVVPSDSELAFLHPLPVERLWGVGPVTARKLHDRGITTVGEVAALTEAVLVSILGQASGRHVHALAHNRDPRPVQVARLPAIDRCAASARPLTEITRRHRYYRRRTRRACHASPTGLGTGRPHRRAPSALRRLLDGHSIAHAGSADRTDLHDPRDREGLLSTATPMIRRRGLTLVGIAVANLDNTDSVQLMLPFDRQSAPALDRALDDVHERFGSGAVTRAVLLGRGQGLAVPLFPPWHP